MVLKDLIPGQGLEFLQGLEDLLDFRGIQGEEL
jgi:hypothetical protein